MGSISDIFVKTYAKRLILWAILLIGIFLFLPRPAHAQYYGGAQYGGYFIPNFYRPPTYQPQPTPQPYPYFPTPSYPNYFGYQQYQPYYYQPRYNTPYHPPVRPWYPPTYPVPNNPTPNTPVPPNVPASLSATCSSSGATVSIQQPVYWLATGSGGVTGSYTYHWSVYGDVVSYGNGGNLRSQNISATYATPGIKQAALRLSDGFNTVMATCSVTVTP
ncbi:MAG: hypothetical protein WCV82_02170 [Candidatus Paceibacterota bacterium]